MLTCLLFSAITGCTGLRQHGAEFFVSPEGNDTWSGTRPDPNSAGSDGPFRTLERAREAVRTIKAAGELPRGGLTILIRGGIYPITTTFTLGAGDAGTEESPITWCAYQNEEVSFIGGMVVSGFVPLSDSFATERIDKAYQDKIVQVDLKKQGITNYGEISNTGVPLELFFNGKVMTLARYPNDGWEKVADVPQSGEKLIYEGTSHTHRYGIPLGRHYGRFAYSGDRPNRWAEDTVVWMHGYWTWDWSDGFIRTEKIDRKKRLIYPAEPHHGYGYTKDQRFYYLNILEELDSPGEYYLNRETGILYFWPPSPIEEGVASVSILEELMVSLEETSYLTIQGIIFDGSRTTAIQITGGTENRIAGCTLRNLGSFAVKIDGGTKNGVTGCDIYDVASGGIILAGGDRKTLTPAGNYATNNDIHDYSRIFRTNKPAVMMSGVGNRLAHNAIHDAPHAGVFYSGNEHILEFNDVFRLAKETGDVGAFYIGRDWTQRGNIIRYNYFHDLAGQGFAGAQGVYLDDWASGMTVFGNVFYKARRCVLIGGGRDNVVENNIFIEGDPSIHVDARGIGWASYYFSDRNNSLFTSMDKMNYREPPYSEKYPELLALYDDEPELPKYNKILRNISYRGRFIDLIDSTNLEMVSVRDNLIADPVVCMTRTKEKSFTHYDPNDFVTYNYGHAEKMAEFERYGNVFTDSNLGFVDVANKDFRLREDSPAWKLGFKPIPLDKIGLHIDEFRSSLPEGR